MSSPTPAATPATAATAATQATQARTPLTRERVLHEAVALADAEATHQAMPAVSMRALAERLGVVPMALYKHVADKDDLLDGMVDVLISEFAHPQDPNQPNRSEPGEADWRLDMRAAIVAARHVVRRHAWARRAIETRTVRTPAVLSHMNRLTAILLDAGFSPDLAHHAMHALGNRIWGFSPELFNDQGEATPAPGSPTKTPRKPRTTTPPDPADYPAIMAVAAEAGARRPGLGCDEDFEFDFALQLLLDGLERLRLGTWSSPATLTPEES